MKLFHLLNCLPFVTLCVTGTTVYGAEYFVSTGGDDLSDGSFETPFRSIQHGVNQLQVGDTLTVRGGNYHEEVVISGVSGSGTGISWSGGTGWNGPWSVGPTTDSTSSGSNSSVRMVQRGSITRTLLQGLSDGTLSFDWDVDTLNDGDIAYAEVFDGQWNVVWSMDLSGNGSDTKGTGDGFQSESIALSGLGTVTEVRFRLDANGLFDYFHVDNIQIGNAHDDFEAASGTSGITIRSFPNERVVIDGTESIAGDWVQHEGTVYKTSLTKDIWQLFVDGEMMTSARWPNADAWTDAMWDKENTWGHQRSDSTDGNFIDDGDRDLAGTGIDFTGAMAIMNTGSWLSFTRVVETHGAGSNTFTYSPIGKNYHHKISNGSYFFEASMACLDTNKEWYYDSSSNELFLITDSGNSPEGRDIRGKTITYGLVIQNSESVHVEGINFFACTFKVNGSTQVTVENAEVLYPSYSKRMLGSTAKAEATSVDGTGNILRNCSFKYADGAGIVFSGSGGLVENCLFYQIDYSCVGTLHDVMVNIREANNLAFRRNTLDTGGNSVGVKAGPSNILELNRVTNQGNLQHDGAAIQTDADFTDGTMMRKNWIHDNVKFSLRFDSPWQDPDVYGINGSMISNVLWNSRAIVPKGDFHHIYNNLAIDPHNDEVGISIFTDPLHGGINHNTQVINNASYIISGHRTKPEPFNGIAHHNWIGYDLVPSEPIEGQLVDPDNRDFRPRAGSDLIDAGDSIAGVNDTYMGGAPDIGAYEFGDDSYWIPGVLKKRASMPVPKHSGKEVNVQEADLMCLPGYGGVKIRVYIGTDPRQLSFLASQPAEQNIIDPSAYGYPLAVSKIYYWRVDTEMEDGSIVPGEVWRFSTYTGGDLLPPSAPAGVSVSAFSESVTVDWDSVSASDLDHYLVYRTTVLNPESSQLIAKVPGTTCVDSNVLPGVSYFYHVTAVDSRGNESAASVKRVAPVPGEFGFYSQWALTHGISSKTGDWDRDGFSNFIEYGFGGIPTANLEGQELVPEFEVGGGPGAQWMELTYRKHRDSTLRQLEYTVKHSDQLANGSWTSTGIDFIEAVPLSEQFELVTVRRNLAADSPAFMLIELTD